MLFNHFDEPMSMLVISSLMQSGPLLQNGRGSEININSQRGIIAGLQASAIA